MACGRKTRSTMKTWILLQIPGQNLLGRAPECRSRQHSAVGYAAPPSRRVLWASSRAFVGFNKSVFGHIATGSAVQILQKLQYVRYMCLCLDHGAVDSGKGERQGGRIPHMKIHYYQYICRRLERRLEPRARGDGQTIACNTTPLHIRQAKERPAG